MKDYNVDKPYSQSALKKQVNNRNELKLMSDPSYRKTIDNLRIQE